VADIIILQRDVAYFDRAEYDIGLVKSDFTQRIFTALLRRGRLHIIQLSAHTHLTKRQIQHGLAVLIQQNLIYHHLDESDDRTYYEANFDAAYGLVRSGKIVEVVEDRFGVLAKDIMQDLLYLGHCKVSELEDAFEARNHAHSNGSSKKHNGVNGVNGKSNLYSIGQLHSGLAKLLESGFVQPVFEQMFRSPTDTLNLVERDMLRDKFGGQTKGTKQKEELKNKVREKMKSWRDERGDWKPVNGVNGHGKKRKLSTSEAPVNGNHGFRDEGLRLDVGFEIPHSREDHMLTSPSKRWLYGSTMRNAQLPSEIDDSLSWQTAESGRPHLKSMLNFSDSWRRTYHDAEQILP
jgi:DNA-directed RNA polymerase III subunit RPC3